MLQDIDSYSGFSGPAIIWQFKVEIEENKFIADPLNATKTVIVSYNTISKQLNCQIHNREINNLNHTLHADVQVTITYHPHLHPMFYRTFRNFTKLRRKLLKMKSDKEYINYMKKLSVIFPATHEDDLFR